MKKLLLFIAFVITAGCSQAQNPAHAGLPPYRLLNTDSVYVTPANLKKHIPIMLVYFQPDCPHCEHLMHDLRPSLPGLKNVQIVLATFVLKLKPIRDFQHKFGLDKYANITIGTEGYTYLIQQYYNVSTTPYIAIYDKDGKLSKSYDKVPAVADLLSSLKKVQ